MASDAIIDSGAALSLDPFLDPRRIFFGCDLPAKSPFFANFDGPIGAKISADELFSDGKLLPPRLVKTVNHRAASAVRKLSDPYNFSRRTASCAARWREPIRFLRSRGHNMDAEKASAEGGGTTCVSMRYFNIRSLRRLLNWKSKSAAPESMLLLPLIRYSDSEFSSASSSRPSLSSTSSFAGPDRGDLPRLQLDSEDTRTKHTSDDTSHARLTSSVLVVHPQPTATRTGGSSHLEPSIGSDHCTIRRSEEAPPLPVIAACDSPRMNSSGKVVFHGLERRLSSHGSFTGGPRRQRTGDRRAYPFPVLVKPVLNVVPFRALLSCAKSGSRAGLTQQFNGHRGSNRRVVFPWHRLVSDAGKSNG